MHVFSICVFGEHKTAVVFVLVVSL